MIRTKIVCTIGPATRDPEMLRRLMETGMDVARLNFSHGDQAVHAETITHLRRLSAEMKHPLTIMVDLQGPKLRVGDVADPGVEIIEGERVTLTTREVKGERQANGDPPLIPVQNNNLPDDVTMGERVLIDDGLIELEVNAISGEDIHCTVVTGGIVKDNKGINLPGTNLSIDAITEKDWEDLRFAIDQNVDFVALSFVRTADEVRRLQEGIVEICQCDWDVRIRVIAKIEKPQALDHIEEIIDAADGIMVARGDLGIEIPAERVPLVQKMLIRMANKAGKPVITATQMLDSMIRNPRPTRAEASDVANAILDGTDAIMLSGETAVGSYPLQAVRTMVKIADEVEHSTLDGETNWQIPPHVPHGSNNVTDAVSVATCETAHDLGVQAIIASTASGTTARTISKYRPRIPLVAITPNITVMRQLNLSWGVRPLLSEFVTTTDEILFSGVETVREAGVVQAGDQVVLIAGITPNMPGTTNLMTVEMVPEKSD